jgi:hypothetical protein
MVNIIDSVLDMRYLCRASFFSKPLIITKANVFFFKKSSLCVAVTGPLANCDKLTIYAKIVEMCFILYLSVNTESSLLIWVSLYTSDPEVDFGRNSI